MKNLSLIIPPLTPFRTEAELDLEAFAKHCAFLVARGAEALFVAGTTGEFPLLSLEERKRLAQVAVEAAGASKVIVHVGVASTRATLELALQARALGARAVAAVTPYYFALAQAELVGHYRALLEALEGFPLYAYTIPQHAGNDLEPASLAALAEDGLVGIKDSSGDLGKMLAYLRAAPSLEVYAGADALVLALARVGGRGMVSGPAMVMPELFRAMLDAEASGEHRRAEELHRLAWDLSEAVGNGVRLDWLRAALAWRGLPSGTSRRPLPLITPEQKRGLEQRLESLAQRAEALGVRLNKAPA